jgi:hypothetical protein
MDTRLSFRLYHQYYDQLKAESENSGLSIGEILRRAILMYLRRDK